MIENKMIEKNILFFDMDFGIQKTFLASQNATASLRE